MSSLQFLSSSGLKTILMEMVVFVGLHIYSTSFGFRCFVVFLSVFFKCNFDRQLL